MGKPCPCGCGRKASRSQRRAIEQAEQLKPALELAEYLEARATTDDAKRQARSDSASVRAGITALEVVGHGIPNPVSISDTRRLIDSALMAANRLAKQAGF